MAAALRKTDFSSTPSVSFSSENDNNINALSGKERDVLKKTKYGVIQKGNLYILCLKGRSSFHGDGSTQSNSKAVKYFELAATQGLAEAQYNLGVMYSKGLHLERSDTKAIKFFELAATQGLAAAQNSLGCMYAEGRHVERNDAKAVELFKLASAQEYIRAQHNLGYMYYEGRYVKQSHKVAFRYYRLAASNGHAGSLNNLGVMYGLGHHVEQCDKTAVEFLERAAVLGQPNAQFSLGMLYGKGRYFEQSDKRAAEYIGLAASQGLAIAQYNLGVMYGKGLYFNQSNIKAAEYLELAAAQKHSDAQVLLKQLGKFAPDTKNRVYSRNRHNNPNPERNPASFRPLKKPDQPEKVTRIYRRANELPNREKSHSAEENRTTDKIQLRISEQLLNRIDSAAKDAGIGRADWFRAELQEYLIKNDQSPPPNSPDLAADKAIGIRLDPHLLQEIKEAAAAASVSQSKWVRRVVYSALLKVENRTQPDLNPLH